MIHRQPSIMSMEKAQILVADLLETEEEEWGYKIIPNGKNALVAVYDHEKELLGYL